jgi:hypothetical protein
MDCNVEVGCGCTLHFRTFQRSADLDSKRDKVFDEKHPGMKQYQVEHRFEARTSWNFRIVCLPRVAHRTLTADQREDLLGPTCSGVKT